MTEVAVATTSQLAADAAAEISGEGGNAVDCAVAAALLTMNTEPGVCALAGGAYVTIWPAIGDPVTIDGNVAVPGIDASQSNELLQIDPVHMEYGGGIDTLVGATSVAVPGSLAALELAIDKYGSVPWKKIVGPSIRAAKQGFPLSAACHHYLEYSGNPVYSRSDEGFYALHDAQEALHPAGSTIVVPGLHESLEAIAREGGRVFYEGDLALRMTSHVQERGGLLSVADLQRYEAILRPALVTEIDLWKIATNPPPAVGGAILSAMLLGFRNRDFAAWNESALRHLIDVQKAALTYRADVLDLSEDVRRDTELLLTVAGRGELVSRYASSSTVHTSAVDGDGCACAVTASSGYGSGEMPAATGLWLNNCIGELELNRHGLAAGPAGIRLPSNMAPSVARGSNTVLAVGSPGADRITTAIHQFLISYVQMGMSLADAVDQSRLHLEVRGPAPVLAVEPGLLLPETEMLLKIFPEKGMYFGGVGVALYDSVNGFKVAADPRREGGTFVSRAS